LSCSCATVRAVWWVISINRLSVYQKLLKIAF
jgi:hypothetical protein